jgi:hypothetical protein
MIPILRILLIDSPFVAHHEERHDPPVSGGRPSG